MSLHITLLLLAAVGSIGALPKGQSGNSQAALDTTAPAELTPVSAENLRFSRLLKNTANALQFSSISNDAPPIWGIPRDGKKDGKLSEKVTKGNSISPNNFGRRALDYDEPNQGGFEEPTSESKIVAHPYPGNEYVHVRAGKLDQQVEAATNPHHRQLDSDVSASVTSINNKPPRVPLAILRQKKGKRVNISPLFTELPPQVHQDSSDSAAKEFVWVDQPSAEQHRRVIAVNRKGRKHEEVEEVSTNPTVQEEENGEVTTILPEPYDLSFESSTSRQTDSRLVVNVVTSEPRFSVESSSREGKPRYKSRRTKATTTSTTSTTTEASTTSASTSTTTQATTEAIPETTTFTTTTSTSSEAPTTTVIIPVLTSSSPKALVADERENLVADASHRAGTTFHDFEDSQAKLQTAESSQPARVNVRPAQNGKEYEYEYIYYYYDDEDENGEKSGEHATKPVEHSSKDVKQTSAATSTTSAAPSSTPAVSRASSTAPAGTTTHSLVTSSITTSTSTLAPELTSEADFEYEDDASEEEVQHVRQHVPEIQKSTPVVTRTTEAPIHKGVSSAEKLSNSNPINQLDRSRSPKLQPGNFEAAVAEYKLETEASQEDVVQTRAQSRGQPIQHQAAATTSSEEETADAPPPGIHVTVRQPSTLAPASPSTVSELDIPDHMSTLAKHHKDSVNVPIVLKQSSLLKAVPASHLQGQGHQAVQTSSFTTPTTTTTVEITSEAAPSRPGSSRLRNHRLRGNNASPRPSTTSEQPSTPVEEKSQNSLRRPHHRDSSRRVPARRPAPEVSTAEYVPEQQPAASPIIENHARPLPIRPRFPPRTGAGHSTTTVTAPVDDAVSDSPPQPLVTVSAAELNSLDDKKIVKDSHIRAKSANDLFAFARLQQAISSRAPSRIPPKLVAGFVNSGEVTTDAITSSEVTTVSSFGGQSSETVGVSADSPPSTAATTTTTTEAVQLDKYGRQKGRFGGRTRRPLGAGAGSSGSTTTTEAPSTQRNRYAGRRRTSTTEAPEGAVQQSAATVNNAEAPKPKIPQRNRFATRNRGFSTTEATPTDGEKPAESDKPASAPIPRRRPGPGGFQGRRRPNQIQSQTEASAAAQEDTASTATDAGSTSAAAAAATSTATATATPAATLPGRNRFNFNAGGARPRPGAAQGAGPNPLRVRGGGRLRGPTSSTTTEAIPEELPEAQEQTDPEQSQTIQTEHIEQSIQSSPATESPAPPRGVLGRLKNRPKLVVTTTTPPEGGSGDRKHRLNGLLGRRKNLGQLASAVHVKEEVKETTSEGEEANNHALEQVDDDHKGVVVQVSSSVTESEEVNEAHAGEVLEPSSTTPGSILNRLKSQRKPGSIFRKKPDPHGE